MGQTNFNNRRLWKHQRYNKALEYSILRNSDWVRVELLPIRQPVHVVLPLLTEKGKARANRILSKSPWKVLSKEVKMVLHPSTFEYLKPNDDQLDKMQSARELFKQAAATLDLLIPDGPDKTFLLRQLRDCAVWANIAITRNPDGSPRG